MVDWCEDLVSPHSHGASLVYTVVPIHTQNNDLPHSAAFYTALLHRLPEHYFLLFAGQWPTYVAVPGVLRMAIYAIHPQVAESAVPHHDDILRIPVDCGAPESAAVLCPRCDSPVFQPIPAECALAHDTLW